MSSLEVLLWSLYFWLWVYVAARLMMRAVLRTLDERKNGNGS